MNLFEIKDECRKNLANYTCEAFSIIPKIDQPVILDAGCGTGVSSIAIIELCNGTVHAVDPDQSSLQWFQEKITALNLNDRVAIYHDSILNTSLFNFKFDIVLAEGLLNIIGFKKGLRTLIQCLKNNGYLIIHDELKNDSNKRLYFQKNNVKLLHSFELNEHVWLHEYFGCLKSKIMDLEDKNIVDVEMKSINANMNNSKNLRSIFYILKYEI